MRARAARSCVIKEKCFVLVSLHIIKLCTLYQIVPGYFQNLVLSTVPANILYCYCVRLLARVKTLYHTRLPAFAAPRHELSYLVHLSVWLSRSVATALSHPGPPLHDDTPHLLLLRLRSKVSNSLKYLYTAHILPLVLRLHSEVRNLNRIF